MAALEVQVDNRLRLLRRPAAELERALKRACEHANPDHARARAMGRSTYGKPPRVRTWREEGGLLTLPRGATGRLREACAEHGVRLVIRDRRARAPTREWPPFRPDPEDEDAVLDAAQERGKAALEASQQGIVRAPTGCGKTHIALAMMAAIRQRSLVIVRDMNLLRQWMERARDNLGLDPGEVGIVGDGKRRIGERLTVALQQSLWSRTFPLASFAREFGAVFVDEVQGAAARTVQEVVDAFPAMFRVGVSADETRKDGKEFLIYDAFGEVLAEIRRDEVERSGRTVPVVVRLVPTDFRADWYRDAPPEERDFRRLVDQMVADEGRNLLVRRVLLEADAAGQAPALVFTHRREHARALARDAAVADGLPAGLMLGGVSDAQAFDEAKRGLREGRVRAAFGTYQSIGVGLDVPAVVSGVVATPIGSNPQFFGQVRGRACRAARGKSVGWLYYLWDRHVFPGAPRNLIAWNDGRVEVFDRAAGRWARSGPAGDAV